MNPSFILQEMGIVLGIPQQDPTFFNLDFLTYTGIIPGDWDVTSAPPRSAQAARVSFANDVSLVAEPKQTLFLETLGDKSMEAIECPKVAQRFVEIMKKTQFTSLAINFRGYVAFPDSPRAAHDFFFKSLLAPGEWHQTGTAPTRAGLNLIYTFDQKKLDLTVQEAAIQRLDESSIAALIFTGAFQSDFAAIAAADRLGAAQAGIREWEQDLRQFVTVISRFFASADQAPVTNPAPTAAPVVTETDNTELL